MLSRQSFGTVSVYISREEAARATDAGASAGPERILDMEKNPRTEERREMYVRMWKKKKVV